MMKLPLLLTLALCGLGAAHADEIVAVSSRVSPDYVRQKRADGSFQPETYAFGPGGYWSGTARDASIDQAKFLDVAHVIAEPLAGQNYLPSQDPNATKLLIMVYWGATNPPDPQKDSTTFQNAKTANDLLQQAKASGDAGAIESAENAYTGAISALHAQEVLRRKDNARTSRLLGYDSWWESTSALAGTTMETRWHDMLDELESGRYFVVLMAYDFQLMWKQKKAKLLWETRFSLDEHHHNFDEALPAMALHAAKYFGQDSHGLRRRDLPQGQVELGELKSLGAPAEKEKER